MKNSPVRISAVLFVVILTIGYVISHHKNPIEKRYGFCVMTPDLRWTNCHIEPLMIRCIEQDGAFAMAGFRDRDILVSPTFNTVNAFLKSLKQPKGAVLVFEVIPYDDFKAVCESDKRGTPVTRFVIAP
jgi:hypothetical protein